MRDGEECRNVGNVKKGFGMEKIIAVLDFFLWQDTCVAFIE